MRNEKMFRVLGNFAKACRECVKACEAYLA